MKLTETKLRSIIKEEIKKLNEYQNSLNVDYLMKTLKDLKQDAKRNKEKDFENFYSALWDELNRSYRGEELELSDMDDIVYNYRMKKYTQKVPEWVIDDLFNI